MHEALVLSEPLTVRDAVTRGLRVDVPDGSEVVVFDSAYHFAVFECAGGLTKLPPVRGPFPPPP